ncbi:MAG: hypothetical protein IT430_00345 [Phycisphaerales bacterium]|nr:hypothetical protein [Phycisphaerales bacterium]
MKRDAIIPSMFHRRLLLLLTMVVLAMFVLVGQLYRLTVVHGAEHRNVVESALVDTELLPTYRGRIVDRNGEVLALDRPCFDVLVDYRLISGEWAIAAAGAEARRTHREEWNELSRARRDELIEEYKPRYDRQVENVWRDLARLGETPLEEIEQRRDAISGRVEAMAQHLYEKWAVAYYRQFQTSVTVEDVAKPILEQRQPHVILTRIPSGQEGAFKELSLSGPQIAKDQPGITVRTSGTRDYPWSRTQVTLDRSHLPTPLRSDEPQVIEIDGSMSQLLGSLRDEVNASELAAWPLFGGDGEIIDLQGYLAGDEVGSSGMERALEATLRGTRGHITRHVDDKPDERVEPRPGGNVQLTIDARLQTRVQALLDPGFGLTRVQPWHGHENELPLGTPLAAGAVVIDVKTSEVLALVSSPTSRPRAIDEYRAALKAEADIEDEANKHRALDKRTHEKRETLEQFDRDFPSPETWSLAVDWPYAPGSIVKPLFLSWAMSHGAWNLNRTVDCQGHFYPENREALRCWIYRAPSYAVHGPLGPVEAIARSCNMYFYTIGHTLGLERCTQVYEDWGLGRDFDIGLPFYNRPVEYSAAPGRNEPLMLAMGQGSVAWTPLHAAAAYAALARGGYYISPTLIRDDPRGVRPIRDDLELDDQAIYLSLKGLHEVVNNQQYGGARHIETDPANHHYEPIFNAQSVNVWGKTGTAQQQWPSRIIQYDLGGRPLVDAAGRLQFVQRAPAIGSHSWFVGLVGPGSGDGRGQPEYAIAVIVQWGGSGSRCAGPIANQIIHALKAEGYLP